MKNNYNLNLISNQLKMKVLIDYNSKNKAILYSMSDNNSYKITKLYFAY